MISENKELSLRFNSWLIPLGSIETYISLAYGIPILQPEEEARLAKMFKGKNDISAARKLAFHNLRFVVQIAKKNLGYGLSLEDLIQEGNIGLLKAIKRFNPDVGVRLATFAQHWIRSEIHEHIIRNWRIVKIATTKERRKLFFKLRQTKKRLGWMTHDEAKEIAKTLDVSLKNVIKMEKYMGSSDATTDTQTSSGDKDDGQSLELARALTDERTENIPAVDFEKKFQEKRRKMLFQRAFRALDKRSAQILRARWLGEKKLTLALLAKKFNLSQERIRQIEVQAIENLRNSIKVSTASHR